MRSEEANQQDLLLPCLSEWEAEREVGRSEPDGQRGMVVKLLFFYNTRLRVRQCDINKKNSS